MMPFIPDWLSARSELSPDRLALSDGQKSWSFRQLNHYVGQLTTRLFQLGIRQHQRVSVLAESNMKTVAVMHALVRLGAILVPINPRLSPNDRNLLVQDADPTIFIGSHPDEPSLVKFVTFDELWHNLNHEALYPSRPINLDDVQCIVYTSGTTGRPKGALISFGNIFASATYSSLHNGTAPSDLWLHVMPLFHIGGLSILFRSVIVGNGIVLLPRFDSEQVLAMWTRYPISLVSLVPTMLYRLLQISADFPSSLRLILLGGAPPSPSLVHRARALNLPVVLTYGLTETSSQVVTELPNTDTNDGSGGHPIYPTEISILSDGKITREFRKTGEILVKGPTVFKGYWRESQITAETFHEGWLKTGDVGFLNDNGTLTVMDRQKDLIIRGGENISPVEIERVFMAHPLIHDAGVLPVDDDEWGQVPVIMLVKEPQLTHEECRNWAQEHLSVIKRPTHYYEADSLPRTASGKLRRTELQKLWQHGSYHELI